ncbi:hypothetical protein [Nocardiopsis suaedae]|uniref:Uncharacterized protein n=1 Tax=Nocardiopsis suaedae TaxID=3018444 RepID=A0ABT4TRY0_9ACTN|nr:hypothetical protein [Nocardiopsis suaedae]MDA2807141.1 hypothetical protein [Nocardiopsis suaedae]
MAGLLGAVLVAGTGSQLPADAGIRVAVVVLVLVVTVLGWLGWKLQGCCWAPKRES